MDNYQTAGVELATALDRAFHHFNRELFDHRLPEALIVVQRKRNAHGYFWAEQFHQRDGDVRLDEIALNPDTMGRSIPEVLSTLVHEMTHLEQHHYGKPGKGGHHNREWGELMDRVGLTPTSTGEPGGARTGRKVTHMIVEDGPFAASCQRLVDTGYTIPWHTLAPEKGERAAKVADKSKTKHTCPECQQNAWAKLGANLACGDCMVPLEPVEAA